MLKQICLSSLAMLFMFIEARSQSDNEIAIGASTSYRLYSGSVFLEYRSLHGHLAASAQLGIGKYNVFEVGPRVSFYPLPKAAIQPLLSFSYLFTFGTQFSYDRGNMVFSVFRTKNANYLVPMGGFRYDARAADRSLSYLSIVLQLGYKFSSSVYPGVALTEGPPYPDQQSKIARNISDSFVGEVSLIYDIPINKKKLR